MKNLFYFITFCLITSLLVSCANIVPPSGGPRDLEAPEFNAESSIPNSSSNTNYSKEYIELTFDEHVQVTGYQNEIYTTPSLDLSKIKVSSTKNIVRLEFKQFLEPNTTYTIHFGKCIRDVTENNIAENVQIAFSTGPVIDSLSVSGEVLDHLTNKPSAKTFVGLYQTSDTSKLFSDKPKYFTQTNSDGSYSFNYIKSDEYELISFTDVNKNYAYDRTVEKIGFLSNPISLDSNSTKNELRLIREPDTVFKILSIIPRDNYIQVKLNKSYKEDNTKYPSQFLKVSKESNIFQLFDKGTSKDSTSVTFTFTDSLGTTIDSTINILVNSNANPLEKIQESFYFERIRDTTFFSLEFFEPIISTNDSITLFRLSDSTIIPVEGMIKYWSNSKSKLQIFHPSFKNDTIEVRLSDSLFTSLSNSHSLYKKITYLPYNSENFGTIEGEIISDKKLFELQLIDNQYNILEKHQNQPFYKLSGVAPGKYSFRILIDDNYDGYIEPGNFNKRIVPESVYFHKETLDVKANWEFLDINIKF